MTGYRAFSYEFVKTFPVLSKGFEIETEMSIHAVDKNMQVKNVVIEYRSRPDGSMSKLNTYTDGFKVLVTIARLYRTYRPMSFFGSAALVLAFISFCFFIPVVKTYIKTGLVPNFPTLIVCGFAVIAAIQSLFSGMILSNIVQEDRRDFEAGFKRAYDNKKGLEKESREKENMKERSRENS